MIKILLVEDNDMLRNMLSRRLQRQGYQLTVATDGMEALEKARVEQPHLIIMDIGLPILDGWQATQHIKLMPETSHIPVIALTAHAFVRDRDKSLAVGCDDYLTKPVDFEQLLNTVEMHLNRVLA